MSCSYICNKNKCHPNSSLKSATPFPRPLDLSLVVAHTSTIAFSFYLTWQEANLLQQFLFPVTSCLSFAEPRISKVTIRDEHFTKGIPHNRKIIQTNFSYLYIYVFLTGTHSASLDTEWNARALWNLSYLLNWVSLPCLAKAQGELQASEACLNNAWGDEYLYWFSVSLLKAALISLLCNLCSVYASFPCVCTHEWSTLNHILLCIPSHTHIHSHRHTHM